MDLDDIWYMEALCLGLIYGIWSRYPMISEFMQVIPQGAAGIKYITVTNKNKYSIWN